MEINCVLMSNKKLHFPYSSLCTEINMGQRDFLLCKINHLSASRLLAINNEELNYGGHK